VKYNEHGYRQIILFLMIGMIKNIEEHKSLKLLNTFGFEAKARYFSASGLVSEIEDILDEVKRKDIPLFILGGGSNVVFANDFDGLVLCPQIKGMEIVDETREHIRIKVGAGVVWDDFVHYAVENNWGGVENLSAIPGNVGASPVQNIGAYGMEAKDTLFSVNGILIEDGSGFELQNSECNFAYRNSIFKNELRRKTIVTHVTFRLSKSPEYKLDYGNLRDELKKYGDINLENIRKSVIDIRARKLPDPKELGNAGSFFKNPIVELSEVERLLELFPTMPVYPSDTAGAKLSAGWLIERCGLKGYREKNIGVHCNQALVLVNYGEGTASELITFSQMVQNTVLAEFGVQIEPEVNFIY
jgi:UDP-N-acetylmuramate dehydrogenase